jgi:ABC-type dipeptide/oligopeptide/nickel transport system ATPase component
MALLDVRDLSVEFDTPAGPSRVVDGVRFAVESGEVLAIVGESGSGKTVSALAMLKLLRCPPAHIVGGSVHFDGIDLIKADEEVLQKVRGGRIGLVLQDPLTALNPVLPIGRQITESLELHLGVSRAQARSRAIEVLAMVGIPSPAERSRDYPHQFSGGMRQRVMIAIAMACNPALLIADEPTTALDVTIQAQIIDLVKDLQRRLDMAVIWITHDLGVVARLATRMLVMRSGCVVEQGDVFDVFAKPTHPYTIDLLNAVPRIDRRRRLLPLP